MYVLSYAAGLCVVDRFSKVWKRGLPQQEIEVEKDKFVVFDISNRNPCMNLPKYISENLERDERTYINKDANEIISSYRFSLLAHNASGFESQVLLTSLVKK